MRRLLLVGISAAATGGLGFGGGFAAMAWTGETVLAEDLPATTKRRRGKRGPARVTRELVVELDPAMNPLAATIRLESSWTVGVRIVDPGGAVVFEQRSSGSLESGGKAINFLQPIAVAVPGRHTIECDLPTRAAASIELRRNAILPSTSWMFSCAAAVLLGMLCIMRSLWTSTMERLKTARRAAAADGDEAAG